MKLYADLPGHRTRQQLLDGAAAAAAVLLVRAGVWVHDAVDALAAPARTLQHGGQELSGRLGDAADGVGGVPLAGDALRTPLDQAADASRAVADAGSSAQGAVHHLATVLGLVVALLPLAWLLLRWLPGRVGWVREASAAERLRGDTDLLAVRAATTAPLTALSRLGPAPVTAWRRGDEQAARALAGLELARLGLAPDPYPTEVRPVAARSTARWPGEDR